MIRKPFAINVLVALLFTVSTLIPGICWGNDAPIMGNDSYIGDFSVDGEWNIDERSVFPLPVEEEIPPAKLDKISSRTYFVQSGPIPEDAKKIGYGGALNLKYYSGISYDYIQKELPGKTLSVDVFIPENSVSESPVIPNKLRISMKSDTAGEWTDIFPGGNEWTNVRKPGKYSFDLDIPEKTIETSAGKEFDPANAILFSIDYYLLEGAKSNTSIGFSFSNFKIDGVSLDPNDLKWQFTKDGYAVDGVYLPEFVKGSTMISSIGKGLDLDYTDQTSIGDSMLHPFSGQLRDIFLMQAVYIPKELRHQKGTLALTLKHNDGTVRSSVKSFNSANLEGKVFLTLPLDAFKVSRNIEEVLKASTLSLKIRTMNPHTPEMMPIVLDPVKIKQGRLIAFDPKWEVRDSQEQGGYPELTVSKDGPKEGDTFTVDSLGKDQYQVNATIHLKGGIDWENPYYKVEFMREFDDAPVDLDDMHIEVMMNPYTDTMNVWQRPFRARVGLLDENGAVMFGPNISLSEGLPSLATLDVSTANPMPKGLVTPGFNPHKVKAILLNIEASQGPTEPIDLELSFVNLSISPREYTRIAPAKKINFSNFKREPEKWELTKYIKDAGGYLVGMNYPFPLLDLPQDILKIPQIYPSVGMKANDPMHMGFSSKITTTTLLKDLIMFAENDINVVRFLVMGHLEGVYTFDERGKDIAEFGRGEEALVQEAAGMSVEKLAEFLNKNESSFFQEDDHGNVLGLEKHVIPDFIGLLDILEKVEEETGKRLLVVISFYDFLLGDGSSQEGPLRMYSVGEHPEVVTDPLIKVKAQALLWKIVKTMSRDPRFYKYVGIAEIMNEPANATILSTRKHFVDLLNFCGEGLYLLKDAIGPTVPVSVGFRSWPEDLRYWAPIGDGVDVMQIHYWESLESYNIDLPGLWPVGAPAKDLWKYLGQEPDGRLTGMAEISPGGKLLTNLFKLEKAYYDFSLIWSYSGHDSYDAKPLMKEIIDYQKGNYKFAELLKFSGETIKMAFIYISAARDLFDSPDADEIVPESGREDNDFKTYLSGRIKDIHDAELRKALRTIIEIADLKNFPFSQKNLKFILLRAVHEQAKL